MHIMQLLIMICKIITKTFGKFKILNQYICQTPNHRQKIAYIPGLFVQLFLQFYTKSCSLKLHAPMINYRGIGLSNLYCGSMESSHNKRAYVHSVSVGDELDRSK